MMEREPKPFPLKRRTIKDLWRFRCVLLRLRAQGCFLCGILLLFSGVPLPEPVVALPQATTNPYVILRIPVKSIRGSGVKAISIPAIPIR